MAHGLVGVAASLEPAPGRMVQRAHVVRRAERKARQEHLAQQRVQAIPALAVVAADLADEEVLRIQVRKARGHARHGLRLPEQRGAQRRAETVAGRHAGEQVEVFRRQAHQHFALEIACEGLRVAHLDRRETAAMLGLEIDREQLQAGDPAVGEVVQGARVFGLDAAELFAQEALGLFGGEAQVAQIELAEQALGAQARHRQWQRQRMPRAEHQVQVGRCVFEQPLQGLEDARLVVQVLHVVQHQHQLARAPGDFLHQRDDPVLDRRLVAVAPHQQGGLLPQGRVHLREAGQHAVEEARQLVIFGRERQPSDVVVQCQQGLAPSHQRARLSAARRSLYHHAALAPRVLQARDQRVARHQPPRATGRQQLGAGDGFGVRLPGRGGPGRRGVARGHGYGNSDRAQGRRT
ncbi:hypothetical protein D3C86_1223170 [compost metagenome]